MKTVAEVIGVSRSNLVERLQPRPSRGRIGRPPLPDEELVAQIKAAIAELPTYRYRRVHAILKRQAVAIGLTPPNHKRVYRVMKVHSLLLDRHASGAERRHDGRIAVDQRNRRWCSDGFEIGCDNGERVRIAFALDCCDWEAMSFLATTGAASSLMRKSSVSSASGTWPLMPSPISALCIERSNCKLASRKGAPLIAVKRLELTSVVRQNSCHFEWALGLRLDKFDQICGQRRICSEVSGKMDDGS
jgi:hypothetical protein